MALTLTWNQPSQNNWIDFANCTGLGSLVFFEPGMEAVAQSYCAMCPVKAECIEADVSACGTLHTEPEGFFGVGNDMRAGIIARRKRYRKQFLYDISVHYGDLGE